MTHAHTRAGTVLHFPPALMVDADGVLMPPPAEDLATIAAEVAPKALPIFVRDLMMSARRRRYQPRWAALNRARLELARLCLDRLIAEGLDT